MVQKAYILALGANCCVGYRIWRIFFPKKRGSKSFAMFHDFSRFSPKIFAILRRVCRGLSFQNKWTYCGVGTFLRTLQHAKNPEVDVVRWGGGGWATQGTHPSKVCFWLLYLLAVIAPKGLSSRSEISAKKYFQNKNFQIHPHSHRPTGHHHRPTRDGSKDVLESIGNGLEWKQKVKEIMATRVAESHPRILFGHASWSVWSS